MTRQRKKRPYDPAKRRAQTLARYGLTEGQFAAMYERQGGMCDICAKPLPAHPHVDHDHGPSKRVRGLLCWWCNRFIGNNRNKPLMFRNAYKYLVSDFDGRLLK